MGSVPCSTSCEGRMSRMLSNVRFGFSRPRLAPAVCRLVRVNPGCAAVLIRFQPTLMAKGGKVLGQHQVGKLGLGIGEVGPVAAQRLQVIEVDPAVAGGAAAHG